MKSDNDIAGQPIDIEWHVCLGDTSLQILQKLKNSRRRLGTHRRDFQDRIIFASMYNDITNVESQKVQGKCLDSAKEVASGVAMLEIQQAKANFSFC